jgi:large subunit ribosomal protein L31
MKKDLHDKNYRLVVFKDLTTGDEILTKSTVKTSETIKLKDGNEYPLVNVHITSYSHPFFTGEEKILDVEGRVDKFKARAEKAAQAKAEMQAKAAKTKKPKKVEAKSEASAENK